MVLDTIVRFGLGGILVAIFAVVGSCFEPKTFSGIFSAAPSVALATLAISYAKYGASYVAIEGRSMIGGAAALTLYSLAASVLVRRGASPWLAAMLLWALWLGVAYLAWRLLES